MPRSTVLRPLAGATALVCASLYSEPALALMMPHNAGALAPTAYAVSGRVQLRGILVALHPRIRTGDLALSNGNVLPLRFASRAQEQRLHLGDRLLVTAAAHGHARLLVRTLRIQGSGNRWWGNRWWMRGVIARPLGRGTAEMVGVNGATVVVHVSGARVSDATQTAQLLSPSVAYADNGPGVKPGEAVRVQTTLTRKGVLVALTVQITATHVAHIDLEGMVTAVNRAAGTISIVDENGQKTQVTVGQAASAYHAGQSVELSGSMTGASSGTVRAQRVEHEGTGTAPHGGDAPAPATGVQGGHGGTVGQNTPEATATATPAAHRGDGHDHAQPGATHTPGAGRDGNGADSQATPEATEASGQVTPDATESGNHVSPQATRASGRATAAATRASSWATTVATRVPVDTTPEATPVRGNVTPEVIKVDGRATATATATAAWVTPMATASATVVQPTASATSTPTATDTQVPATPAVQTGVVATSTAIGDGNSQGGPHALRTPGSGNGAGLLPATGTPRPTDGQ